MKTTDIREKPTRIIFLDIDGVIATTGELSPEKQDLLEMILEKTGAKIVLSSSWRKHTLEDTVQYMRERGFRFCDDIIGVTIRAYHYIERGGLKTKRLTGKRLSMKCNQVYKD